MVFEEDVVTETNRGGLWFAAGTKVTFEKNLITDASTISSATPGVSAEIGLVDDIYLSNIEITDIEVTGTGTLYLVDSIDGGNNTGNIAYKRTVDPVLQIYNNDRWTVVGGCPDESE